MNILLLSTYELGHQPLGLASPAAHLTAAGHNVWCRDLAVEALDEGLVREAELVAISAPMHTATRLGARLAAQVRTLNADCHIAIFGLYAALNTEALLAAGADSVIGGEFETPLVALAESLDAGGGRRTADPPPLPLGEGWAEGASSPRPSVVRPPSSVVTGVRTAAEDGGVFLGRQAFLTPRRDQLRPLDRYARLEVGPRRKLAGYVEASRGCAHGCRHCPVPAVYGGRLRIVPEAVVLEDIRHLVAIGAEHITFGDPDFFNGVRHSLRIVEAMHAEFPALTFDATIKIEHLLEHRRHLPALAAAGCLFIVSAVEAIQPHILEILAKGHAPGDVDTALSLTADAGITLRPTFLPFTPWTSLDDYLDLLDFIAGRGLIDHVDPVQLTIRLLVPRGSLLVGTAALAPHLGPYDEAMLAYRWVHPDPRVDRLQAAVQDLVATAVAAGEDARTTFSRVRALARTAAGRGELGRAPQKDAVPIGAVPRLTEPWFC
jgi:radical SAM superfamily enzyme YgiQ (UPF0313 family)